MRSISLVASVLFCLPLTAQFDAPLLLSITEDMELFADLDNDGDVDVIAFQYVGSPGSVLKSAFRPMLNTGFGVLTPGTSVPIPANAGYHVATGDIDGDGFPDVLVTTSTGVLVYRSLGNALYAAPVLVVLPGAVVQLGVGNKNSDAIADVFVLHGVGGNVYQARWLLGGPGLALPLAATTLFPGMQALPGGAMLDIDGDGVTDFAQLTTNGVATFLSLFRTTPTGFVAHTAFAVAGGNGVVIATDLDGDGDQDLIDGSYVASNQMGAMPFVNQGGGVFLPMAASPLGAGNYTFFAGDWDGDGDADLVARTSGSNPSHTVRVFEQVGGQFTLARTYSVTGTTSNLGAGVRDIDGDGLGDFVDSRSIVFNTGIAPVVPGPYTVTLTDWDGDGDLDHVQRPELARNDGNGVFAPVVNIWPPSPGLNQFYGSGAAAGDFDGDGLHELLASLTFEQFGNSTFLGMRKLEANGDGFLVDVGPMSPSGVQVTGAVTIDVDLDGDLDFVNGTGLWQNDGTGAFTLFPQAFQLYTPVAKGDVDGDGDQDLLAVRNGLPSLAILYQTGPTSYSMNVLFGPFGGTSEASHRLLVDLDDDGDLDAVALQRISSSVTQTSTFLNDGAGVFTPGPVIAQSGILSAGDVDLDGTTDLCIYSNGLTYLMRRTGPGLTYTTSVYSMLCQGLGDIDQDGDLDVLGNTTTWNRRFHAPSAGYRRQYGLGSAGTDGRRPLLSVLGPVRTGSTVTARVVAGYGGSVGLLFASVAEANVPNVLPGVTMYVGPVVASIGASLSGPFGQPGAGSVELPIAIPPGVNGAQLFLQFALLDPAAPAGLSHSNGCELSVGL